MSWNVKRPLEPGARAPEFELETAAGGVASSGQMLSRGPVLLVFFKASCPVCQLTFPFLERLHQAGEGALQIVGVSQDDRAAARAFNREFGISFPALIDRKGYPVSNAFGIDTVPTLFLVDLFFFNKFLKSVIYTIPEYLEYRYHPAARAIMALYLVIIYVAVSIAAVVYTGALALHTIFDFALVSNCPRMRPTGSFFFSVQRIRPQPTRVPKGWSQGGMSLI